jgi:energy-coupling factor transport system ATP-binding protein
MLEIRDVQYRYGRESLDAPAAVAGVSLSIAPGTLVGLLGQNGSGKSSLAKLLAGVLIPQSGAIIVDGIDTRDPKRRWEARRLVGLVFQHPDDQLITNTLVDDVAFGPENLGLPREEIRRRVDSAIATLALEPYVNTPLHELSLGLRQRAAIAGVLAMQPRFIVLDEPSAMLPPQVAHQLIATVTQLARARGIGVIYITHHMDEVTTFDRVVVLAHGEVALDGPPRAVFSDVSRLRSLGLDAPDATLLAQRLRARGYDVRADTLLDDELASQLQPLLGVAPKPTATDSPTSGSDSSEIAQDQLVTLPEPLLETRRLSFTYMRDTPFAQQALDELDSRIEEGRFVAFVGPTRSGKSTLLDCLNAIVKPGKGMVYYRGADTAGPGFDLEALRLAVGVVYQSPDSQLLEDIVGKDVAFGLIRRKTPRAESRRIVQECLEAVGLAYEDFRNRYTYALSGGEKRRVAIAGALAMRPTILALDEPVAGLDPQGRAEFIELIKRLRDELGLTVAYMSASLEDVAEMADQIYILDAGRVAFSGAPEVALRRLPELERLGVGLSGVSRLALALAAVIPALDTACLTLDALESEVCAHLTALAASSSPRQEMAP